MKKIICPSCDANLTEVGVYCKTYNNFKFNEKMKNLSFLTKMMTEYIAQTAIHMLM